MEGSNSVLSQRGLQEEQATPSGGGAGPAGEGGDGTVVGGWECPRPLTVASPAEGLAKGWVKTTGSGMLNPPDGLRD